MATKTTTWTLAPALGGLFGEVNSRWPKRAKGSDGTIGDADHSSRDSEHNPNDDPRDAVPDGMVTAGDITKDSAAQMEAIRKALIADDRVWYVIHNGKIWSRTHGFRARAYTGSNPHTGHLHVSLVQSAKACRDVRPWGIAKVPAQPDKPAAEKVPPTLSRGDRNPLVSVLKRFLGGLPNDDEKFGPRTDKAVRRYQTRQGLVVDGVVGPNTWARILTALDLPGYNS